MKQCHDQSMIQQWGEKATQNYCSCILEKLEKKYSNFNEMNAKGTQEEGIELGKGCLQALTGVNIPDGQNNNDNNNSIGSPLGNNNDNNNNQMNGWTQVQFQQFVQGCSTTAQQQQGMTATEANTYCTCMTTKVAQQYTFEQASQLTPANFQTPEWQQAKIDCGARRQ